MMYQVVQQQAAAVSYLDMFWLFSMLSFAVDPAGLPDETVDVRRGEPRGPLNECPTVVRRRLRSRRD